MPDSVSRDCALLRSLTTELAVYLEEPTPPTGIRFASIRWEIIRRMSLILLQSPCVPCETSRGRDEQGMNFDADWRVFVANWSGVWIFNDWNASRSAARAMLDRLSSHLDELARARNTTV